MLKIAYFIEKTLPISLKLNFTPNTSHCYGLTMIFDLLSQRRS